MLRIAVAWICGGIVLFALGGCGAKDDDGDAGGDGGAGAGTGPATCEDMCEKLAVLECSGQANCSTRCTLFEALREQCGAELDALVECSNAASLDDFECNAIGDPMPKPGVCEAESQQMLTCAMGASGG